MSSAAVKMLSSRKAEEDSKGIGELMSIILVAAALIAIMAYFAVKLFFK